MDISAQEANRLWQGYDGSLSAEAYANGIAEAYHYGRMGVSYGNIDSHAYAAELPEQVRKNAYMIGKRALETQGQGGYNNTTSNKEDLTNGTEAVHLRRGVQRTDGESSDGIV